MTAHSELLGRYKRAREVRFRLNNLLVSTIPKKTLEECARKLGFLRKGTLMFDNEDESAILMDYCIYHPEPDGRNLVAKYLEKALPPDDSEEMAALRAMTDAYYSLFQILEIERGVGVSVRDFLRGGTGFIFDIGYGNTAKREMLFATRVIPFENDLMTGGAGLPVDSSAAKRIANELTRTSHDLDRSDFNQMTPWQEAELAAMVIRSCLSTGMSSRIAYAQVASAALPTPGRSAKPRLGRNDPCHCGSGKKFKVCCWRG